MTSWFYKITRVLQTLLKPLEYILALIFSLVVAYILLLRLNVPQQAMDGWAQNIAKKNHCEVTLGEIKGMFPVSFHVQEIALKLDKGKKIMVKDLDVFLNWRIFRMQIEAGSIVQEKSNDSENPFDFPPHALASFVQSMTSPSSNYNLLTWFQQVRVRKIVGVSSEPFEAVLQISPQEAIMASLLVQTSQSEFQFDIQRFLIQKSSFSFNFEARKKQQGCLRFGARGQFHINDSHLSLRIQPLMGGSSLLKNDEGYIIFSHEKLSRFLKGPSPDLSQQKETFAQGYWKFNSKMQEGVASVFVATDHSVRVDFYKKQKVAEALPTNTKEAMPLLVQRVNESKQGYILTATADLEAEPECFRFGFRYGSTFCPEVANFEMLELQGHPHLIEHPQVVCSGSFSKNQIKLEMLKGTLQGEPIRLRNIVTYDMTKKEVSPIWIDWGKKYVKTSIFSFKNAKKGENRFFLSPQRFEQVGSEETLHFGTLNLEGSLSFENQRPCCCLNFRMDHAHCVQKSAKSGARESQCLDLSVEGVCKVSQNALEIASCKLMTRGRQDVTSIQLEIIPVSKNFLSVLQDLKNLKREDTAAPVIPSSGSELLKNMIINGKITGNLSLLPIAVFFKDGDLLRGELQSNLTIQGTLQNPQIKGKIDLKGGLYENIKNGVVLKNVQMHAVGKKNFLDIQAIHLIDGTRISQRWRDQNFPVNTPPAGTAGGWGTFRLFSKDGYFLPELMIILKCNNLQVAYSDLVKARATGKMTLLGPLSGRQDKPTITGSVVINAMTVDISAASVATTTNNKIQVIRSKNQKNMPDNASNSKRVKGECFGLDIVLKAGEHVMVRGDNGLKCFLRGNITAKGPLTDPYLVGELTIDPTKENRYNLFGKIMIAKNGKVQYETAHLNDPTIRIELQTKINGKEVWAVVSGLTSAIHIALHSNPPMSNEAILSLLLFRQGLNKLSANQNLRIKAFSSQMLQNNPLGFFDKVRHSFGLDSLEVVETQDIASGETVQTIRVGKQIKKVRVYVDQDISSKNKSKMTVRYDLTPRIGIEANVGIEKSASGVGIQWMKQY